MYEKYTKINVCNYCVYERNNFYVFDFCKHSDPIYIICLL